MRTFITGIDRESINYDYFNLLEQFEYDMFFSDATSMCLEAYNDFVMEAEKVTYGKQPEKEPDKVITKGRAFADKVKLFFTKIIDLVVKLIKMFMDKADELFKINEKFLKDQANLIRTVKNRFWNEVHIDLYDYNTTRLGNSIYAEFNCPKIDDQNNKLKEIVSFEGTEEELRKKYFPDIMKHVDDKTSFKEAAKIYFRNIQGADSKPTHFNGTKAQIKVIDLLEYATNYKNSLAKKIRDGVTGYKGSMQRVYDDFEKGEIGKYITKEAALLEDGAKSGDVYAENENGNTLTPQNNGAPHVGDRAFSRIKQYGSLLLTIHTAQMTIAEECYFSAIHVLKKVYSIAHEQGALNLKKQEEVEQQIKKEHEENAKHAKAINKARKKNSRGDAVQASVDNIV